MSRPSLRIAIAASVVSALYTVTIGAQGSPVAPPLLLVQPEGQASPPTVVTLQDALEQQSVPGCRGHVRHRLEGLQAR